MAITIRDNSTASSHRGFFNPLRDHELDSRSESIALPSAVPKASMWHRFGLGRWLHRDEPTSGSSSPTATDHRGNLSRRLSRKVGAVGLPRPATFGRQNSEQRDRLTPIEPPPRRTQSADRRRTLSVQRTHSPVPSVNIARLSAPEVGSWSEQLPGLAIPDDESTHEYLQDAATLSQVDSNQYNHYDNRSVKADTADDALERELERKWILNLSMHFRDKSEREKFFVTYAERPNRWRRVTISCDYRNAPEDSLERDLKELHYQRDKSARIYESIRESLPEIQFYDTVTNLKLETSDGRLHVHVTEDVNETIPYPPVSSVRHLGNRLIPECDLIFDSHLSGFVYKVQWDGKAYIKKEIPGPDTVDEFLYEINALHALYGSQSVIQFEGIIVDDRFERVKGLLISYAEQGALVDVLYDFRGQLSLDRRERWARQIVQGLCEIHEAGYVQGDFTLSNIVIDANDNAKIIDINRRGCPVGWEPPEIAAKIESNQRISMYIGVKSDLFQLGMTLWALAMQEDEPERQPRPLFIPVDMKIPEYYRRIIAHCLSDRPRDRLSAKELLIMFPHGPRGHHDQVHDVVLPPWTAYPPGPPYYETVQMDTNQPFCLDNHQEPRRPSIAYVTPAECDSESDFPEIDFPPRGRRQSAHEVPPSDNQSSAYIPSNASPIRDHRRSISQSDFEVDKNSFPAMTAEPRFEEVEIAGTHYLVNPNMLSTETFDTLGDNAREPYDPHGRSSDRSHSVAPASDEEPKDVTSELKAHIVPTKADLSNADGLEYRQETDRASICNPVDASSLYQVDDRKFPQLNNDEEQRADEPVPIASASSAPVSPVISPESQEREESGISLETRAHSILREIPLLQSNLPINPGVSRVIPPSTQSTVKRRSSLFSSKLPINPALSQTTPRRYPPSRRNSLFGSLLPINPALPQNTSSRAIQQGGISQSASNPSVNSMYQHTISTTRPGKLERPTSAMKRLSYLLDSVLPINPAVSARRRDRMNSDII